jgi:hypothetical protein
MLPGVAHAQTPETITYQGYLTDGGNTPLTDADATLTFRLYDANAGGTVKWTETQTGVSIAQGVFSVQLGAVEPLAAALFDQPLFLSVAVGEASASELSPRVPLTATPYSFQAQRLATGQAVASLNGLTDEVVLEGGNNVTVTSNGNALTIAAEASGFALPFDETVEVDTAPALQITNTGSRGAARFVIDNTTNFNSALLTSTTGTGLAAFARTFGSGQAGLFRNEAFSNVRPALEAFTAGSGPALLANHGGSSGDVALFQSGATNVARIDKDGTGFFNGGVQSSGADVAEAFAVEGDIAAYEPGDVLVISTRADRALARSSAPYSTLIAGVYATRPGLVLSERGIDAVHDDLVPTGIVGVLPTKVSGENGPIRRGDLLVTSSIPGHAMKADPDDLRVGTVLGKALEDFSGTRGRIKVLVNVH